VVLESPFASFITDAGIVADGALGLSDSVLSNRATDAMLLREIASSYAAIAGRWMLRFWCSSERTPIIRRFVG
jgi:hypothetical protein